MLKLHYEILSLRTGVGMVTREEILNFIGTLENAAYDKPFTAILIQRLSVTVKQESGSG